MAKAKTTGTTGAAATAATATGATAAATAAAPTAAGSFNIPVDGNCPLKSTAKVHEDYDCMLNQTNIGANNNKFYVIQVLESGGKFYAWNRWGRVGETGQTALKGPYPKVESAIADYQSKFKDKSGNSWENRKNFVAKAGKYALIEIERSADSSKAAEVEEKLKAIDKAAAALQPKVIKKVLPSALHPSVQNFMKLIFDQDMFKGAMASFDIDVKKMPLGQITKSQVKKGYDVLEELEQAINSGNANQINTISSKFYTLIPHSFGRRVPPPINTPELLHKKVDMLNVLNDIEIALTMEKSVAAGPEPEAEPHPADENYKKIKADLEFIDPTSEEYGWIQKYLQATGASYYNLKLVDVFRLNRHGEADRFKAHDPIAERKLLWHGTNVAVVAAILGSGLRIMPHSGGRVGKGIYLASENGKSVNYVGWAGTTGVMFLAEAALGKEHSILKDDSSLKEAPKGFDCIVARGHTEPDPQHDITITIDGKKVIVPQGKPIKVPAHSKSSFTQSEYLLYKESQVRLRYVLRVHR
ncbi:MAG: WGR domain-containing protein [Deltaproteobacteria bacterium]|nr:WGR domain-containing protein [Myxococcales bacterium]MDP3213777.1 WGR domain-containing protein [Deltaproteobacteria bacterium]